MREVLLICLVGACAVLAAFGAGQFRDHMAMPEYMQLVEDNRRANAEFEAMPARNDLL